MAIRNSSKNLAETIRALAAPVVSFKKCCLGTGSYDGERRNYFFQGLNNIQEGGGCRPFANEVW